MHGHGDLHHVSMQFTGSQALVWEREGKHSHQHTSLECLIQSGHKVGPNQPVEILPPAYTRHLAQHRLDSLVYSADPKHVTPAIRTAPDPNFLPINLIPSLRIGDRITDVVALHVRQDLMSRLTGFDIAGAEAAVVVDEAADGELRGEILRERVKVHLFQGREPVRHYQTGQFGGGRGGRGVEPAAEGDLVGGLE
jgi:hypothetical protein